MRTETDTLIDDTRSLTGVKSRFGRDIAYYDDGYGPLWVHRGSMGISGVVRAETWEKAYSICEDEFFPDATESEEEIIAEYGNEYWDDACFQKAFGYRNTPGDGKGIVYAKDLNGDYLDLLTPGLVGELEVTIETEPCE